MSTKNNVQSTIAYDDAGNAYKLTRKQKAMADYLINNPKASATEAVMKTYNATYNAARAMGTENLAKPSIQAYMSTHAKIAEDTVMEVIAVSRKHMNSGDKDGAAYAAVALTGAKDIMDRVYGKAKQQLEVNTTAVTITIDMTSSEAL